MNMLVDCSNCHTPLHLPPGAKSFRCAICRAITFIATTPPPPYNNHYYPPPPAPVPVPSTYNNHWHSTCCQNPGRKKAVIVGIIYKKQKCQLKGCINDAKNMRHLLISRFKFPQYSIILLTEEERDPYRIPIKHNIKMAMHWLVQGCQAGDSLVFYYSGHGSQVKNSTGDEVDGSDETLCPLDHETEGMIFDNEINATIVKPLPRGAKLHAIIDACCSGTMLDLPYLCRMHRTGRYEWEDHHPRSGEWKGTSGGEVISFSGCDDNQSSADAASLSKMTFSFIKAIERGQGTTYGGILNAMRSSIRSSDNDLGDGIVKSLLRIVGIRRRQTTTQSRVCTRIHSNGGDLLGDFGARDPFPAEIESQFGDKVLGNTDTEHKILIPTASALSLAQQECIVISPGQPPLSEYEARQLLFKVVGWRLANEDGVLKLQCTWKLRDFECGVELIKRIGKVVEGTGHLPSLHQPEQSNQVHAELWTASIGGLSVNDFIVAAKIDQIKTSDLVPRKRVWA